jgi:hypothetical protein
MSTLQQQTKAHAASARHLAEAYEASNCANAEELRKHAVELRGSATILNGWVDGMRDGVRAAVDEDAPKIVGHVHPHDFSNAPTGHFARGGSKYGKAKSKHDHPCKHLDGQACTHEGLPEHQMRCGRGWCDGYAPKDTPCRSFVCNMCAQGLFEGPCGHKESQKHCHAYNPAP